MSGIGFASFFFFFYFFSFLILREDEGGVRRGREGRAAAEARHTTLTIELVGVPEGKGAEGWVL